MDRAAERINFLGASEWPTEICVGKPDGRDVRFGCARAYHETLASNDELRLRLLGRKGKLPPCLCRRESNKRGCSRAAAARRRGSLLVSQREGEDVLPSCVHTRPTRRCRLEYLLSVPELKRVPSSANAGRKNTREGQAGSLPEAALFPPPSVGDWNFVSEMLPNSFAGPREEGKHTQRCRMVTQKRKLKDQDLWRRRISPSVGRR